MLGLEPTRRNRTGLPKSRVTKSKKDPKSRNDDSVKSEPAAGSPPTTSPEPPQPAPQKIKQENPYAYNNRLTPALTPGPVSMPPTAMSNTTMLQNRFMTPCSDTDTFPTSPAMSSNPATDMVHSQGSFDFHTSPCPDHADPTWPHGTSYFAAAYPFEDYTSNTCNHQHLHHTLHPHGHLGLPSQSIETDVERAEVKREEWNRYE
jgi:hypothetical protein